MIVLKTLNGRGRSPVRNHPWPLPSRNPDGSWTPGEWVVSAHVADGRTVLTPAAVDACAPAVYGSVPERVAQWIAESAWWMELDDAAVGDSKVGGSRGRLLRPVEGWTNATLHAWALWCADRAIHIHAVGALRAAGLTAAADRLDATPEIVDETTARAAEAAARAAARATTAARAARAAARAARAAEATAWSAGRSAAEVAGAAGAAAGAAARAARTARDAEMRVLSVRLAEMAGIGVVS